MGNDKIMDEIYGMLAQGHNAKLIDIIKQRMAQYDVTTYHI